MISLMMALIFTVSLNENLRKTPAIVQNPYPSNTTNAIWLISDFHDYLYKLFLVFGQLGLTKVLTKLNANSS